MASPPRKSEPSQTPNINLFWVAMSLEGGLAPAQTVGRGVVLLVLIEIEALLDWTVELMVLLEIEVLLGRIVKLLEAVEVPTDKIGSSNLKTTSAAVFARPGFRTFFGQPALMPFWRADPRQFGRLEQSSASNSRDVIPGTGSLLISPSLKSVLRQTPKRMPLVVVMILEGP